MALGGQITGEDLEAVEGGETVNRIYCMRKKKTFKEQNRRIQWEIKWSLDLCRSGPEG